MTHASGTLRLPRARFVLAVLLCTALRCAAVRAALDGVTIEIKPPEVRTRIFDPAHPPNDMPKLSGHEAAEEVSEFTVATEVATDVIDHARAANGDATVVVKVTHVTMTTQLKVTIWLPIGCPDKLKAHEEGHHEISERHYKDADKIARDLAAAVIGQSASAQDKTLNLACRTAVRSFVDDLNRRYMRQVQAVDSRTQDVYDELTRHGTNDLPEEKAIRQAIERVDKESAAAAATQPAGGLRVLPSW